MRLSREFIVRLKLNDRPAYRIAQEARVDPRWLSKAITRAIKVFDGDERVILIGKILGLKPDEIFEEGRND